MKYDAIFFDFDGVLAESVDVKSEAFFKLYEAEGSAIQKKVLEYHIANGGVNRYEKIRHIEKVFLGRAIDEAGITRKGEDYSKLVEERVIVSAWVEGSKYFLDKYHKTLPMYVISATPQEELLRIVQRRGMAQYFKAVYGAPEKKHAHAARILENEGYKPDRVLMVGDAMADYEAAKATGINFIGRTFAGHPSIFPEGTRLIDDLTALEGCLS